MNKVVLMGRLTKDPIVNYDIEQNPICRFFLAVDRRVKKDANNPNQVTADFIACVCFGKTAEFVEKYLRQGSKIACSGRIQTGSYTDKDGKKVYTTEVVLDEAEFAESKNAQNGNSSTGSGSGTPYTNNPSSTPDGFISVPDGIDEELRFA